MFTDPCKLEIPNVHDRAYIYVNKEPRGILSRAERVASMPLTIDPGDKLQVFVENQGRVGYGPNARDFKGLVSNVTLNGKVISNWAMYSMPLNDTDAILKYVHTINSLQKENIDAANLILEDLDVTQGKGSFWYGEFIVPCSDTQTLDTFLRFPKG